MLCRAFFTVLFLLAASGVAKVPAWIADPAGGPPIWLSAAEARRVDGSLRWELFPPSMQEDLKARLEVVEHLRVQRGPLESAPERTCQTYRVGTSGLVLPDISLESFFDYAELAAVGRVRGTAQGFYRGQVSALVEVEVEQVLKRPPSMASFSRLYFRFSQAEVAAAGEMLCVRNEHFPDRPVIGRRVLLFADGVADREPLIVSPHASAVILEREDGTISLGWERGTFSGEKPDWSLVERQLAKLGFNESSREESAPEGKQK